MAGQQYLAKDYKSELKPIWCPGCGDFGVLTAIQRAFSVLQIPPENIAVISGIGCSSRIPGYLTTYGFNGIHGRALPIATGVKLANPELTVVVAGGDGDGFSIGGGHIAHAARRDIDITYLVMDNGIYGLTKGQLSPTSPIGLVTQTSVYGNVFNPIKPVRMMLGYRASFVARGFAGDSAYLHQIIVKAIQHKGFAFVDILSPCVTYRGKEEYDRIRNLMVKLEDEKEYDPTNFDHALKVANETDRISIGVIYEEKGAGYYNRHAELERKAKTTGAKTIEGIMDHFLP